jgi:hypothetical protein
MEITFSLPHVFSAGSDPVDNAQVLRLLLESLIAINRAYLRRHPVPALYQSGVVYRRTVTWDSIPELYAKKFGDCKSLAAALIAEYRNKGIQADPEFRWYTNSKGERDYHILVEMANQKREDPSRRLGMGARENAWPR